MCFTLRGMRGITIHQLWFALGGGVLAVIGWVALTRTTFFLAYGQGGTLTLHQVQGLCDSSIGQVGQLLSSSAAGNCASVDTWATMANLAGAAGLLLAVAAGVVLAWRSQRS